MLGAAPSGRAADELARATYIPAATLHSLLLEAGRSGGLPRGSVLVVDETGMAETRVLAPVLRAVDAAGGKAILVGDPSQLPSVGAGGLYGALCERLGAVSLVENRRQHDPAERDALARLRAGDAEGYLGHAAREGRLLVAGDVAQAKERLLADWWRAAAEGDLRDNVMLAHRRADVRDLNEGARALLRQGKQLACLGWVGRRRHGDELREVIGAQLRVLADLRTELRELPTHDVHVRPASLERPRFRGRGSRSSGSSRNAE